MTTLGELNVRITASDEASAKIKQVADNARNAGKGTGGGGKGTSGGVPGALPKGEKEEGGIGLKGAAIAGAVGGAVAAAVGGVKDLLGKIWSMLQESSGILQGMIKLLYHDFLMILKPMGDVIGLALKPLAQFLAKANQAAMKQARSETLAAGYKPGTQEYQQAYADNYMRDMTSQLFSKAGMAAAGATGKGLAETAAPLSPVAGPNALAKSQGIDMPALIMAGFGGFGKLIGLDTGGSILSDGFAKVHQGEVVLNSKQVQGLGGHDDKALLNELRNVNRSVQSTAPKRSPRRSYSGTLYMDVSNR